MLPECLPITVSRPPGELERKVLDNDKEHSLKTEFSKKCTIPEKLTYLEFSQSERLPETCPRSIYER